MRIGETQEYKEALRSLDTLRDRHGIGPELKAIAKLLAYCNQAEAIARPFPWVGLSSDPRDLAVVQAWEGAWKAILDGDDFEY